MNPLSRGRRAALGRWGASVLGAVAMAAALLSAASAQAQARVRVEGLREWLRPTAERSLSAVWEEMPPSAGAEERLRLLRIVSDRLLSGYRCVEVRRSPEGVSVRLEPDRPVPGWAVEFGPPSLSAPLAAWLREDLSGRDAPIGAELEGVPLEALTWGDEALLAVVRENLDPVTPGWRKTLMVVPGEGRTILRIGLIPDPPLVLAVAPTLDSTTLPTVLHAELREDLLKGLYPAIGMPVPWIDRHRRDMEAWTGSILQGANLVVQSRSTAAVKVEAEPISRVNVQLESRRYVVWAWGAVYAGAERPAEVGLHVGRRATLFPRFEVELYGEWIAQVDDGSLEGRYGLRWSPWGDVWLGAEWVHPGDAFWGRFMAGGRIRRPYVWLRLSEEGEANAAGGYRLNEHISLELHYDERDEDPWSVRAVGNL